MKQEFIRVKEAEVSTEHVHVEAFQMHGTKKYGVLGYWESTAFLMEFDSVEELAEAYGVDAECWMGIDKIKVGESVVDDSGARYMRIW